MAAQEQLVLDGLALNDPASSYLLLDSLSISPPRKRQEWLSGSDADGSLLVRDPLFDNRTVSFKLRVINQGTMDLALAAIGALSDKLEEAEKQDLGLSLVWTPANGSKPLTLKVCSGEIEELPISKDGEIGWFRNAPILSVRLDCFPFLYGTELTTFLDDFSSNTIANYTVDAGAAGNVSITGGVMTSVANPATENRFIHTSSPYTLPDAQATLKHTVGTTLTNYKAGVILKRIDASNYCEVYVDDTGAASRLRFDVIIGGSRTNRVSIALTRITISTAFWIRARMEGNNVFLEHWTAAPTATGTPAAGSVTTIQYTLASGSEQNTLGQLIKGRLGIVWTPQQAAATLDDFQVDPHLYCSTDPAMFPAIVGVLGDVRAEARAIHTERSNQVRRYVEGGVMSRYTDLTTTLILDSDNLVTTGFGGTQTTRSGAYDPNASGNNVIRGTLTTTSSAICGTGVQPHIGVFRAKARIYAVPASGVPSDVKVRIRWQDGDGPFRSNPYAGAVVANTFCEVDLGIVTVSQAKLGTQKWSGVIDSYSTTAGDTVDIDHIVLVPALEGYWKGRAYYSYSSGALVARDEFTAITAGTALNARTAPVGGVWATSGAATDFAAADAPLGTDETESRSVTSSSAIRLALVGTTNYTDIEAGIRFQHTNEAQSSVVVRGTDVNNALLFRATTTNNLSTPTPCILELIKIVTGTPTTIASLTTSISYSQWYSLRVIAFATGRTIGQLLDVNGSVLQTIQATDSALATGGALQTGKPGFADANPNIFAATRYYDNFYAATPTAEPISLYGGRRLELRSDAALREDSTGTYWGDARQLGDRFYLPAAGGPSRIARVLAKADRNDIETAEDVPLGDILQLQIAYTPRYVAVPR